MKSTMQLLLIEDDSDHAELIRSHIARKHGSQVAIRWENKLASGLEVLRSESVDVILLDLGLPDSSSIDTTLDLVLPAAKSIPVVVLSSLDDEDFALAAVHRGAQDYLCKKELNGELLFRALRYAIERKRVEESLRAALRAKDEFLTILSHELRTPVGIILGLTEILWNGGMSEQEYKQLAEKLLYHAKLQVGLIDDLLDMSSIITGKLVMRNQAVDLEPLVMAAIDSLHLAAEGKNIALQSVCEAPVGLVHGDPLRIQQILWNLLSNAIKFTAPGGHISVRLRRARSQAQIDVEDDGDGIDPEFLPYVFDRFTQQDRSRTRHAGGLGLGLAIVKYLVELHGGRVVAASPGIGKGATFSIFLPFLPAKGGSSAPARGRGAPEEESCGENAAPTR